MDRSKLNTPEVVEGLPLVKRRPVGWKTEDGRYELIEIRRGLWEAYEVAPASERKHVASGGTRAGLVHRLKAVLDGSYTGALPFTTG
jgi:hypothetical protein